MKLSDILDKVCDKYKLRIKATPDGSIYIKAKQGMYSLPQSGLLANKLLEKRLNKHGYRQQTKQIGTRPLETWHKVETVYIGCRQLLSEIHRRGTWNMPIISNRLWKKITNYLWLDGNRIHQHYIRLEIHKTPGTFVNAKLRDKSIETIPTHCHKTAVCTVPKPSRSIWGQEATCNAGVKSAIIRRQGQLIHPTSVRQILIHWQSSGQHPPLPNQCHCIVFIQTNQRYDAANPSRLPCHAGRRCTLLPCQQYDISSPQQFKLFKQTQSTQQSRWTLLSLQQHNRTTKQWSSTQHCTHNQKHYAIGHVGVI